MQRFMNGLGALALAALMGGGCAHGTAGSSEVSSGDERTVIRVTNNNWSDMTIYLVRSGTQQRLGNVPSQSTGTFIVPTHVLATASRLHLAADPIGSSQVFLSAPLLINPGQSAEWKLENTLALSSVWIR
jgi:hypothetical protein